MTLKCPCNPVTYVLPVIHHDAPLQQVHWHHLPPALMPTPGSADQDGVFSGCVMIDYGMMTRRRGRDGWGALTAAGRLFVSDTAA